MKSCNLRARASAAPLQSPTPPGLVLTVLFVCAEREGGGRVCTWVQVRACGNRRTTFSALLQELFSCFSLRQDLQLARLAD